jgi:hypothetical protein
MSFWIEPDWPAPAGIRAVSTLRAGGTSSGPYASLNLGHHVGDDAERVRENRRRLYRELSLPEEPVWLQQVHGTRIIDAANPDDGVADGSIAARSSVVCAVMTADCLPILLCSKDGERVAAVHGGWRGLAAGVLAAAVEALGTNELAAWLGPAIGPEAFEVGDEVRSAFVDQYAELAETFHPTDEGRWLADIYAIARSQLTALGIPECYGGGFCTYSDTERFFSYRRDGTTGRMATLIWRE